LRRRGLGLGFRSGFGLIAVRGGSGDALAAILAAARPASCLLLRPWLLGPVRRGLLGHGRLLLLGGGLFRNLGLDLLELPVGQVDPRPCPVRLGGLRRRRRPFLAAATAARAAARLL